MLTPCRVAVEAGLLLDGGVVVEDGPPALLRTRGGPYARLEQVAEQLERGEVGEVAAAPGLVRTRL